MSDNAHVFVVCHKAEQAKIDRLIKAAGCQCEFGRFATDSQPYSKNELADIARRSDAMMVSSWESCTRPVMEASSRLRTIAKFGIGLEKIDLEAATSLGILVSHTPISENYVAVAEGTVARILALSKSLKSAEHSLRSGFWKSLLCTYMRGKTVGIIGLGRIGSRLARLLEPWELKIVAYDPYIPMDRFEFVGAEPVNLESLLRQSDFVTIHCNATEETSRMIGEEELRMMKNTAYLVNTARGTVLDDLALARALREGWIAGAALDVFEPEPLHSKSPLLSTDIADKIWLTPHVIAATPEARSRMAEVQVENCLRALEGEIPRYVANPDVIPLWRKRISSRSV